jgi:RNA polymerase sigma-54 factor
MALTQRLELRQGQTLVMTPQLQQAIKLLQLSNLELAAYVEQELERNPLLERDESAAAPDSEGPALPPEGGKASLEDTLAREDFTKAEELDARHEDLYDGDVPPSSPLPLTDWSAVGSRQNFDFGEDALESSLASDTTLKDHLAAQLSMAALSPEKKLIGIALIDGIDEAGYLRIGLDEIAERLGAALSTVQAVLSEVQGYDPVGVAARDLAECLRLQLRAKDRLDPAMDLMLSRLDLIARRDTAALSAVCGVDADDISDMLREVRALTPKPGLAFGVEPVQPVVPDVFVREGPDGAWHVELNSDTLPRLLVNSRYYTSISGSARDRDSKSYIAECLNSANWLVKSLDQRARTILKVAGEIVRQQDGFLTHGVRHLRPLNLRTIADAISMHESTVSRVTSNKYVSTPRGVFELKYFFTAAIQSVNGSGSHSAEAVRDRIREMIDNEPARGVLSDDRIVSLLTADGVNIARRTVAKYREAMRIPSSVERRRLKDPVMCAATEAVR